MSQNKLESWPDEECKISSNAAKNKESTGAEGPKEGADN